MYAEVNISDFRIFGLPQSGHNDIARLYAARNP